MKLTRMFYLLCVACVLLWSVGQAPAQPPAEDEGQRLELLLADLNAALTRLDPKQKSGTAFVDAAVCAKAVDWILRHQEFYRPNYGALAERVANLGDARIKAIQRGEASWGRTPGGHALAYRSRVDGSLQPYGLSLPAAYQHGDNRRWPLYIVLHGRNATLTEASFMAGFEGKAVPESQKWIQLDVFGRTNNAYRWSGETDVFEALADVMKRYKIDEQRITLWGFSMGGAGAWHLGLQHPSRWASVGAGAGFVDFYEYQRKSEPFAEPVHSLLRIYDSVEYALNLHNVPFIGYGGEEDPQLKASLMMQKLAQEVGAPLQVLVGPKMGHKFDDESLAKFMAFLGEHNERGRPRSPGRAEIRFTTPTLKYNQCEWLKIEEQEVPFQRSVVESTLADDGELRITTSNVAALSIDRAIAPAVSLGGGPAVSLSNAAEGLLPDVYFVKEGADWRLLDYDESVDFQENSGVHKRHNLQGPIDDAFMEPFLCVRGTGTPWSPALHNYAEFVLFRFVQEHDKFLRGHVPVVSDVNLTEEDVAGRNLILFGDPGSNSVLARVLDELPLKWSRESFTLGGQTYATSEHAPVLIYPNPLNPRRYVVVNSGMTMRAGDFRASNANLFPKLGDIAVQKFTAGGREGMAEQTVFNALFDRRWKLLR